MAQAYDIRYYADVGLEQAVIDAAPDWMFIHAEDGTLTLYLKRTKVCPEMLLEAWAAYRAIETPLPQVPRQRRPLLRAVLGAGLLAAGLAEGAAMLTNAHGAIPGII